MSVPSLILSKGQLLVTQTTSGFGIIPIDNSIIYGYIERVYESSGYFTVGQTIQFDSKKAAKFIYGSTIYYQVDESDVSASEDAPA